MSSQPSRQTRESRQIDLLESQVQRWGMFNHQLIGQLETQKEFLVELSNRLEFMSNIIKNEE